MYEYPSIIKYVWKTEHIGKGWLLMKIAAKIFEKATMRGLADYLIYGLPPEPDERDYNERLEATYNEFEKIALKYNPDGASDLLSSANDMTCENACMRRHMRS